MMDGMNHNITLDYARPQMRVAYWKRMNKWVNTWVIIIIIIIIIVIIIIITFMQGIYTYIPETNYVPREYSVAAILFLLFMVLISLISVLNLL